MKDLLDHSLTHGIDASLAPLPNTLGKHTSDLGKSQLLFWEISGLGRVRVFDTALVKQCSLTFSSLIVALP